MNHCALYYGVGYRLQTHAFVIDDIDDVMIRLHDNEDVLRKRLTHKETCNSWHKSNLLGLIETAKIVRACAAFSSKIEKDILTGIMRL